MYKMTHVSTQFVLHCEYAHQWIHVHEPKLHFPPHALFMLFHVSVSNKWSADFFFVGLETLLFFKSEHVVGHSLGF